MNNQDLVDFADQLIGKTAQQQAAAGNADGWMSSAMFKTVRSIFDLQKIVAFSAANVTAEMDDNLQKAYEKFRAYVTNPVAGPSDTAQIESILVEIAAAYTAGKLEIGKTCAAFKEFVGSADMGSSQTTQQEKESREGAGVLLQ